MQRENSYDTNILSIGTSESFRPAYLSGVTTQIEVFAALRSAESKNLRLINLLHNCITLLSLRTKTVP